MYHIEFCVEHTHWNYQSSLKLLHYMIIITLTLASPQLHHM